MLQSTGGIAAQSGALWVAFVMSLLILAMMATCVWIGLGKRGSGTPLSRRMMIGFGGYGIVFAALTATYARYAGDTEVPFFGGFPLPTAWMIYGVWLFPILFVALYMTMFDRWVLTDDDLARFKQLVDENRRKRGSV